MDSTARPTLVIVAGVALATAGAISAFSASVAAASGPNRFHVEAHDGMAPGSVAALVLLLGLVLIGIGAAVRDGRELRGPSQAAQARAQSQAQAQNAHPAATAQTASPQLVHVITALPTPAHARRTSNGARLVLVDAARWS